MTNRNEQPEWIARSLIRKREKAVLATVMRETDGNPYASLVLTASDHQGHPLIYISDLAEHTKNLWKNPRASMLFENTSGLNDPLSGARVTLQGTMKETDDPLLKERFFKRHEQSRSYGKAHSFFVFQMQIERAHLVAGFGRIHWLDGGNVLYNSDAVSGLATAEEGIIRHMNEDHQDSLELMAKNLLSLNATGWKMIGVDPEGFDMRSRDLVARLDFDRPLAKAEDSRPAMIELVKRAKAETLEPVGV